MIFPLSLDTRRPCLRDIDEMVVAYRNAALWTFGSMEGRALCVVRDAMKTAQREWKDSQTYTVLLLLQPLGLSLWPEADLRETIMEMATPLSLFTVKLSNAGCSGSGSFRGDGKLFAAIDFSEFAHDPTGLALLLNREIAKHMSDFCAFNGLDLLSGELD
jgi:hypothetical protein